MAERQSTLLEEARWAAGGTWRLVLGRRDALSFFDFSQRGLAGSFIPLVVAFVVFAGFTGIGAAARQTMSPAGQLFICGALITARFFALRVVLPRLDALHAFRPVMVASNWANAIAVGGLVAATFGVAFVGALMLGPTAGETLVGIILTLWAAIAIATFVAEINILRLVAGLNGGEVLMVLGAQVVALILAVFILAQLPLG
ncbi:hypothetical protein [Pelagibacterium halotolerans]|uniref:Uncharacterized protein n=1 Tax=Pelagibacterium halotolerans (strain DSM 22347 / JCM 15775 / CGMCC 1.7692 / B2) TaxID=1082931 RepID=G4RGC9_PELHB|nr:hypothetical protein [Pelagibacterium halotolerans]AEQ50105.1 hypothetical protein KKY_57 [Pelagibacterium halotolerans B2]QJR19880.1 hypothetical protein HKM20_16430 [Pelagibacterium halotolerans]SEA48061.1 hypothetical protein SAMN05428936_104142 [Pelagibacterium halotolerans]